MRNVGTKDSPPVLASFPQSPVKGDEFFLSTNNVKYSYDGSGWNATLANASASSAGANLAADSSMEAGTINLSNYNTTSSFDTTQFRTGVRSAKFVLTDTFGSASMSLEAVTPNKTYTVSVYARCSVNQTVSAQIRYYDSGYALLDSTAGVVDTPITSTGWTRLQHTRTAPSNAAFVTLMVNVVGSVGTAFYFDDLQLEEGTTATPYNVKSSEVVSVANRLLKFSDSLGRIAIDSGFPAATATASTPGFMAAADKSKLDGLGTPITTTGDQTGLTGNKTSSGTWTVGALNVSGGQAVGAHGVGLQDNGNRAYSDSNPPDSFMQTVTPVGTPPANPASGYGTQYLSDDGVFRGRTSAGVVSRMPTQAEYDRNLAERARKGAATAARNISGSTSEQILAESFYPVNTAVVGTTFKIVVMGTMTQSAAAVTSTFRLRIGTGSLSGNIAGINALATAAAAKTSVPFMVEALATVRAIGTSGTVIGSVMPMGNLWQGGAVSTTAGVTTPVTMDTTNSLFIQLTIQNSATTISGVVQNATFEPIQP